MCENFYSTSFFPFMCLGLISFLWLPIQCPSINRCFNLSTLHYYLLILPRAASHSWFSDRGGDETPHTLTTREISKAFEVVTLESIKRGMILFLLCVATETLQTTFLLSWVIVLVRQQFDKMKLYLYKLNEADYYSFYNHFKVLFCIVVLFLIMPDDEKRLL